MDTSRRSILCLVAATAVLGVWFSACSDSSTGPCDCPPSVGLIVSNPLAAAATGPAASASAIHSSGDMVYVALAAGTVPQGASATIRRVGDAGSIVTAVVEGGFDPVPVPASAGDSVTVDVDVPGGASVHFASMVMAYTHPIIVRTSPSRRKRDVPLNASIVIVFSEPVLGASVNTSSVQLLDGSAPVAGTVSLVPGSGTVATFTPDEPLRPNADYSLLVSAKVRDLDGLALGAAVSVPFTTGQTTLGAPASIRIAPDSVVVVGAAAYQLTATVRDAAGNELTDQPITWSVGVLSGTPGGLTVSSTGLLTASVEGGYLVTATLGGLSATAYVEISFGNAVAATVTISPNPASVGAGDTIYLSATVRDAANHVLNRLVEWVSSDVTVATVESTSTQSLSAVALGLVTSLRQGSVTITATSGAAQGNVSLTVTAPVPVASVTVTPDSAMTLIGGAVRLTATLRDASGRVLYGTRPITWTSSDVAVATVDSTGTVTGRGAGTAHVAASSGTASDTAVITVTSLTFVAVGVGSAGPLAIRCGFGPCPPPAAHTCALTDTGAAFCWGDNHTIPTAIAGGYSYVSLAVGAIHACGLTAGGAAYCWGSNPDGELGNGSTTSSGYSAVAVSGGHTFTAISAGRTHTCGLATSGATYCWGGNFAGQLGNGSTTSSNVPVAATGGLTFVALNASGGHTCGLTVAGAAYCWGYNSYGQLGNGSTNSSSVPVAVSGGIVFTTLSAFGAHTCGIATGGAAYCWGYNVNGQLGDGTNVSSGVPVPVAGGLTFGSLAHGAAPNALSAHHTCGVTTAGAAYCWGNDGLGQLGNGSTNSSSVPVPVAGGLGFSNLSTSGRHTCGLATDGRVYCWGDNYRGELGTGTTTSSTVPVKVLGQP